MDLNTLAMKSGDFIPIGDEKRIRGKLAEREKQIADLQAQLQAVAERLFARDEELCLEIERTKGLRATLRRVVEAAESIAGKYVVRNGTLCVIVDGQHWTDEQMIWLQAALADARRVLAPTAPPEET